MLCVSATLFDFITGCCSVSCSLGTIMVYLFYFILYVWGKAAGPLLITNLVFLLADSTSSQMFYFFLIYILIHYLKVLKYVYISTQKNFLAAF